MCKENCESITKIYMSSKYANRKGAAAKGKKYIHVMGIR
jgi:hypothetical protein